MNTIIENSIYRKTNLSELNHFVIACAMAKNENDLRNKLNNLKDYGSFNCLEEKGIRYGFGHHHFWMSERQYRNKWKRILFIDFVGQA
jgi:hypothetical protein